MKAILIMDFMNELVHPDGKFNARGYPDFVEKHSTLDNVAKALEKARAQGFVVVFVKFGFSEDYNELPKNSPLFAAAKKFNAVQLGTWATEFHKKIDVRPEDKIIVKHRINAFYDTDLDTYLKEKDVDEVFLCGVATDLVVQSTARDAHDRDFKVNIIADCCAAGSEEDQDNSIKTLNKIAKVLSAEEL